MFCLQAAQSMFLLILNILLISARFPLESLDSSFPKKHAARKFWQGSGQLLKVKQLLYHVHIPGGQLYVRNSCPRLCCSLQNTQSNSAPVPHFRPYPGLCYPTSFFKERFLLFLAFHPAFCVVVLASLSWVSQTFPLAVPPQLCCSDNPAMTKPHRQHRANNRCLNHTETHNKQGH